MTAIKLRLRPVFSKQSGYAGKPTMPSSTLKRNLSAKAWTGDLAITPRGAIITVLEKVNIIPSDINLCRIRFVQYKPREQNPPI
jgi:hypothetical protein